MTKVFLAFVCLTTSMACIDCTKLDNMTGGIMTNVSLNSYEFEDCVFHRMESYKYNGGAIVLNSGKFLSLKSCSFLNCSTFEVGGAIWVYFSSSDSQIVMDKVCAYKCHSRNVDKRGQFAYNYANNHSISYLTMSSCGHVLGYGTHSFANINGVQKHEYFNSSNNLGFKFSGIHIESSKNVNLSFSNFYNNHVSRHVILHFYQGGDYSRMITNTNVINNSRIEDERDGIIHSYYCSLNFSSCMFSKNVGNLFTTSSSNIVYVSNSVIDHESIKLTDGSITLDNSNQNSVPSTYSHSAYQTGSCYDFTINPPTTEIKTNDFPVAVVVIGSIALICAGGAAYWFLVFKKDDESSETSEKKPESQ